MGQNVPFQRSHLGFGLVILVGVVLVVVSAVTPFSAPSPGGPGRSSTPIATLGWILIVTGIIGLLGTHFGSWLS